MKGYYVLIKVLKSKPRRDTWWLLQKCALSVLCQRNDQKVYIPMEHKSDPDRLRYPLITLLKRKTFNLISSD